MKSTTMLKTGEYDRRSRHRVWESMAKILRDVGVRTRTDHRRQPKSELYYRSSTYTTFLL